MALGRELELVQKHQAEEDLAVAAASILARHEFVTRLAELEKEFGMKFPKGASAAVDAAAKEFYREARRGKLAEGGQDALSHRVARAGFARATESGMARRCSRRHGVPACSKKF